VHVSEISRKKIKDPSEMFKEGVTIQAKVIHVSADERRLGLSIKQLKEEEDRRTPREFRGGGHQAEAGTNLGELLRQNLHAVEEAVHHTEEVKAEETEAEETPAEEPEVQDAPAEETPAEEATPEDGDKE
jgi:small subunit ribosomal protein S1